MTILFFILLFISVIALLTGLIKPSLVVRWGKKRTRGRSSLTYGIAAIVSFILFGVFAANSPNTATTPPSANGNQTTSRADSSSAKNVVVNTATRNVTTNNPTKASTNNAVSKNNTSSTASSSTSKGSSNSELSVPSNLVPAVVSKETDGDTIHVILNGKDETIRMLLIDTPEDVDPSKPVEPYGYTAANYAKSVLPVGKHIYLQEGKSGYTRDKYGRLLAFVYITPHNMYNEDVVKKGLARVAYIYPPNTQHLSALEADQTYAKDHHLDIWSIPGYATSDGYSLSVACPWAQKNGYSTRGCPSTELRSSASKSTSTTKTTTSKHASGSSASLSTTSSTLNVSPGDYASVTIKASPGTACSITVYYKSGPSHASGLETQTAPGSGLITWRWRVGTNTTPGTYNVVISAGSKKITEKLIVK